MLQNKATKVFPLLFFSFGLSLCFVIVFWGVLLFLSRPIGDTSWTQRTVKESVAEMLTPALMVIFIHLSTAGTCYAFGLLQRKWIAGLGILVSLCGLIFALSPIATELCWNFIIFFHLKRGDNNIDFLFNTLRAACGFGTGTVLAVVINWLRYFFRKS